MLDLLGAITGSTAAPLLAAATKVDLAVFFVGALVVLLGALGVVTSRNPIHSALFLVQTLFGVAVLFVSQQAHFLAVVQVVVYAGAIVVLFLFVIMLLGVDRRDDLAAPERFALQRPLAAVVTVLALVEVLLLGRTQWTTGVRSAMRSLEGEGSDVEVLGRTLFTDHLLPFEVTSLLLVIAVVGAVVLARKPPRDPADRDDADREVSR